MKPGTAKDSFLTPGEVDPRHFELLLEGTSIRAQPLTRTALAALSSSTRRISTKSISTSPIAFRTLTVMTPSDPLAQLMLGELSEAMHLLL